MARPYRARDVTRDAAAGIQSSREESLPTAKVQVTCVPFPSECRGTHRARKAPMSKAIIGVVQTMPKADQIVGTLQSAGFRGEDISVLLPNKSSTESIAGALVGLGIPEIEAKVYEGKIRGGNLLIAVHSANGAMRRRAAEILKANGAEDVSTLGEASVPTGDYARIQS